MRRVTPCVLALAIAALFFSTSSAEMPPFQWLQSAYRAYVPGDVAFDPDGNCLMVGRARNGANFDGTIVPTIDVYDGFLAKYAPDGTLLWVRVFGGSNPNAATEDDATTVGVDAIGNCYVTGKFGDSAHFDSVVVNNAGLSDIYIAKFDPEGTLLWVTRAGSDDEDVSVDMVVTADGDCYITGWLHGANADFGATVLPSQAIDGYLAKCDTDGNFQWVSHFSGAGHTFGRGVALTPEGDCVVVGSLTGNSAVGDSSFTGISPFVQDALMARFDATGTFQWAMHYYPPETFEAVGIDGSGNIHTVGTFLDGWTQAFALQTSMFSSTGAELWADTLLAGPNGYFKEVIPKDIAVAADGTSITTGGFNFNTTFGDTTFVPNGLDAFVIRREPGGAIIDALHGGNGGVWAEAVDVDANTGAVLVAFHASQALGLEDTTLVLPDSPGLVLVKYAEIATAAAPRDVTGVTLSQNVPNPFNPSTLIQYQLVSAALVRLDVYDVAGRHVRSLANRSMPPGTHSETWNGVDAAGHRVATGVYFYRLRAGDTVLTKRMVLIK